MLLLLSPHTGLRTQEGFVHVAVFHIPEAQDLNMASRGTAIRSTSTEEETENAEQAARDHPWSVSCFVLLVPQPKSPRSLERRASSMALPSHQTILRPAWLTPVQTRGSPTREPLPSSFRSLPSSGHLRAVCVRGPRAEDGAQLSGGLGSECTCGRQRWGEQCGQNPAQVLAAESPQSPGQCTRMDSGAPPAGL